MMAGTPAARRAVAVAAATTILAGAVPAGPVVAQGGATLASIGEMRAFIVPQIQAFRPSKGGGASSSEPYVRSDTSTPTIGGRTVTRDSSYRIVMATDRDTITFIIERTERYAIPGATDDDVPYEVRDSGGVTLQVDTCPDDDGTVRVTANAAGTYDLVGGGVAYHTTLDTRDVAVATVDHAAELAGWKHELTVRSTASGERPSSAGGLGSLDARLDGSAAWAGKTGSDPEVTLTDTTGVDERHVRASFFGGFATASIVDAAIEAAETVWRSGRCLELEVEPPGKRVDPASDTEITVTLQHKAFDEEVKRDIEATLDGPERIAPDTKVMAPATFTYTATSDLQGKGTITFRSVSNRGIAEERVEVYEVAQALLLDAEGSTTSKAGALTIRSTYRGEGLRVVLTPGDGPHAAPRASIEGSLSVRGRVNGLLGRFRCRGTYRATLRLDAGQDVSAQAIDDPGDRRLSVHLVPADPDATIDFPLTCNFPTGVTKVPHSLQARDVFPIWSGQGTAVELPLTGGTVTDRKTTGLTRFEGSLTLRLEEPAPRP